MKFFSNWPILVGLVGSALFCHSTRAQQVSFEVEATTIFNNEENKAQLQLIFLNGTPPYNLLGPAKLFADCEQNYCCEQTSFNQDTVITNFPISSELEFQMGFEDFYGQQAQTNIIGRPLNDDGTEVFNVMVENFCNSRGRKQILEITLRGGLPPFEVDGTSYILVDIDTTFLAFNISDSEGDAFLVFTDSIGYEICYFVENFTDACYYRCTGFSMNLERANYENDYCTRTYHIDEGEPPYRILEPFEQLIEGNELSLSQPIDSGELNIVVADAQNCVYERTLRPLDCIQHYGIYGFKQRCLENDSLSLEFTISGDHGPFNIIQPVEIVATLEREWSLAVPLAENQKLIVEDTLGRQLIKELWFEQCDQCDSFKLTPIESSVVDGFCYKSWLISSPSSSVNLIQPYEQPIENDTLSLAFPIDSDPVLIELTSHRCLNSFLYNPNECQLVSVDGTFLDELVVSPNPFTSELKISSLRDAKIEVYDLQGKSYYSFNENKTADCTINTQNWPKGVYILKVSGKEIYSRKLVKM